MMASGCDTRVVVLIIRPNNVRLRGTTFAAADKIKSNEEL